MKNHVEEAAWQILYSFGIYFILWKKAFYYYKNLFDQCLGMINDIEQEDERYIKGLL